MPGFAQGNQYESPRSGVGAYLIGRDEQPSALKAYIDTYDTVNRWKREKENDLLRKQQYIKENFPSLDYDTKGILPSQNFKDYFLEGKERLLGIKTAYGTAGQDPATPQYRAAYAEAENEMKKQKVYADASMEMNKGRTELFKQMTTHPELYDNIDEIAAWDEELMNAPIEGEGNVFEVYARMPKPKAAIKTVDQRWGEILKDAGAAKESISKGGAVYESTTYPKTSVESVTNIYYGDKELQKQTEDKLNPLIHASSPTLEDGSTNPDYNEDAKAQIDALQKFTDAKSKESGRPLTLYEGYNIQAAERQKPASEIFVSWSPYTTASAKIWASGQEDKKMFESNIEELLKIQSQDADYFIDDNGDKVFPNAINRNVGIYKDSETGKDSPNLILDLRADIDPATGQEIYKVATSKTKSDALNDAYVNAGYTLLPISGGGGKKGWYDASGNPPSSQKQNEIELTAERNPKYYENLTSFGVAQLFSKAYGEKDRGRFLNYYKEVAKSMGIYDEAQKTATAEKIKEKGVFKGWGENVGKKELLDWQRENISMLASKDFLTPQGLQDFYTRLMPEQRAAFEQWKAKNPTRQPSVKELKVILGLEEAQSEQEVNDPLGILE